MSTDRACAGGVVASLLSLGCPSPLPPIEDGGSSSSGASTTTTGTGTVGTITDTTAQPSSTGPVAEDTLTSTSEGSSAGTQTTGGGCDEDEIVCEEACVNPLFDAEHCGASDPCDANPGIACNQPTEGCIDGMCASCDQLEDFEVPLVPPCVLGDWVLEPDWCIYSGAPESSSAAVPFASNVLGTDGNRSDPYPGSDDETSAAISGTVTFGATLAFRSWHVDEGGMAMMGGPSYDNKIIEVDVGAGFEAVVDCGAGIGLQVFCLPVAGPRLADDWDLVVVDLSPYAGMSGTLRLSYDTNGAVGSFEQGWFIDDLRTGACGEPTGLMP